MPELSFVLPHWLYWSGLLLFPLTAMFLYRRGRTRQNARPLSIGIGYFLLLTGGFLGVHRLYLKSRWAVAFVALFLAVLLVNVEARGTRELLSDTSNAVKLAELKIGRGEKAVAKAEKRMADRQTERRRKKLETERDKLAEAKGSLSAKIQAQKEAQAKADHWYGIARGLGLTLVLGILLDAILLPWLVRRRNDEEEGLPTGETFRCPAVEREHDDSQEPYAFNRGISRINAYAGEFVAYWSIVAVFVYYYEVVARYVFNSPTNWAHEAMFLMFGMQYLIAGGFCLRENAHVRVDVIYTQLTKRTKAIMDLITSVFFFVFVLTLLVTGWIFFYDAFQIKEVSFTEWGIQYWPVKFALPFGALLLLLQGISQLVKDIAVVMHPETTILDTDVRPEG